MSSCNENITIFGIDIAFKPGADMERARKAGQYLEERFEAQRQKAEHARGKDISLIFLALDLADELLQMKLKRQEMQTGIERLLEKIEKSL